MGLTGAIHPRLSRFRTTCSVVGPICPGTTPTPDVSGSSSGPSAASRHLTHPLTTCAQGCSNTSLWRPPPNLGETGCAGGYWAAQNSARSCAWRRSTSSPLSLRVRRLRHIGCVADSETFVSQKLRLPQDCRRPRIADSGKERSVVHPSRRSSDRGARGAVIPTYLEKTVLVRFLTLSHPHSS